MSHSPQLGVVQSEAMKKWCAQLDYYCHTHQIEAGTPKILKIQEPPVIKQNSYFPQSFMKPTPSHEARLKFGYLPMHPPKGKKKYGNTKQ